MIDIERSLQYRIDWEEDYYKRTMARVSTLREMFAHLPELPNPYSTDISVSFSSIDLTYPASFELEGNIVAMLEDAGFSVNERCVHSYGFSRDARYPGCEGATLCIDFATSYEESTCVLNRIGEKLIETKVPVYEVVCPKGANEKW